MKKSNILLTSVVIATGFFGGCASMSDSHRRMASLHYNAPIADDGVQAGSGPAPLADPFADDNFGVSYSIELSESGGPVVRVTDQHVFKSGDRIRLHFKASSNGVVSIIQVDASGTSSVLFPNAAKNLTDDILPAGVDRALPSEKFWFRFDEHAGTEKLLVLFAKNRAELDRKFPTRPEMDQRRTATLIETAKSSAGSKALAIDAGDSEATASNDTGQPLILEINLKHQ